MVPAELAVELPGSVGDELAAVLGIPGITAHRAVFADGPVADQIIVVHGVLGAVGSLAAQLARWGGATVIGTVRRAEDVRRVEERSVHHAIALDGDDPAGAIRAVAPDGVQRIVEVALGPNADLDAAVVAGDAVIAAYASPDERPALPFWPLLFANVTLRLLGSDDFPASAKQQAVDDLLAAPAARALHVRSATAFPLGRSPGRTRPSSAAPPTGACSSRRRAERRRCATPMRSPRCWGCASMPVAPACSSGRPTAPRRRASPPPSRPSSSSSSTAASVSTTPAR